MPQISPIISYLQNQFTIVGLKFIPNKEEEKSTSRPLLRAAYLVTYIVTYDNFDLSSNKLLNRPSTSNLVDINYNHCLEMKFSLSNMFTSLF